MAARTARRRKREELTALAEAKETRSRRSACEARVNPTLMQMKDLLDSGYVGEVMAIHVCLMREGVLTRLRRDHTWQRDAELGANTLTIACGHTVDAMRFVAGEHFTAVRRGGDTGQTMAHDTGTNTWLDVTSPDNVLLSGRLLNDAVVSVPCRRHSVRRQRLSYGDLRARRDALVASGEDSPQLSEVSLHGAKGGDTLAPIPIAERFNIATPGTPAGEAFNVGQMYTLFARAIRGGDSVQPTFATATALHRLVDAMKHASDQEHNVTVK